MSLRRPKALEGRRHAGESVRGSVDGPAVPGAGQDLSIVGIRFDGARLDVSPRVEQELPGLIHRLVGSNPQNWKTGLRSHGRVVYPQVFPGVDIAYHGKGRELEFDFIVAPGADPGRARMRFDWIRSWRVDDAGDLHLETGSGTLVQRRPEAYQNGPEGRVGVPVGYALNTDGSLGFRLGEYDSGRTLVIDPILSYATFLGGDGFDQCWDIQVDEAGFAFVVGETESVQFPGLRVVSTNAFQTNYQGGLVSVAGDAFVAKLPPDGASFEWFTYLGGSDLDGAIALALGTGGEPVVVGFTTSTNFPLTRNAYQSVLGGTTNEYTNRKPLEAFVARLRSDGSGLVMSTLYGGDGEDQALDVVLSADQSPIIVGSTTSTNLPMVGAGAVEPLAGRGTGSSRRSARTEPAC